MLLAFLPSCGMVYGQSQEDMSLICQYFGIQGQMPTNADSVNQIRKDELRAMNEELKRIKEERLINGILSAATQIAGYQKAKVEREQREKQEAAAREAEFNSLMSRSREIEAENERQRRAQSSSYADNSAFTQRSQQSRQYSVGTTSNAQLESARQLENIAIGNGTSRYVSEQEMRQMRSQNEGQTVIGIEVTPYGRISHTLKVDYSRQIPRVNAIRYDNGSGGYTGDSWQYLYIDAEYNRIQNPSECKWLVRLPGRIIYF